MKTPRDLLLQRHQAMTAKLDAVRAEALAMVTPEERDTRGSVAQLWHELFWSCRRVWFGLGAAWAVILMMNVAAAKPGKEAASNPSAAAEQTARMGQRQLLRDELAGLAPSPAGAIPVLPRPRSDWRREERMA